MEKLNALSDLKMGELLNANTEQENLDYKLSLYGLMEKIKIVEVKKDAN